MKGYRTILFNVAMLLVVVLVQIGVIAPDAAPNASAINGFLDHLDAIILFLMPLVNIGLRMVTTTKVGESA